MKFIEARRKFLNEELTANPKMKPMVLQAKAKERWPDYPVPSNGAILEARYRVKSSSRIKTVPKQMAAKVSVRADLKKGTAPVIQSHIPTPMVEAVEALRTVMKDFEYTEVHVGPSGCKLRQYVEQEF